jgi:drug/metabolite transporter (DMT)-like permease
MLVALRGNLGIARMSGPKVLWFWDFRVPRDVAARRRRFRSVAAGETRSMNDDHDDRTSWISWRGLPAVLVPALAARRAAHGRVSTLRLVRTLFVTYLIAIVLIGGVVAVLTLASDRTSSASTGAVAGVATAVAVIGAISVGCSRLVRPDADCSSDQALATWYRRRFFLRIALSELAALIGFAGFILIWTGWIYPIGLAIALVGFAAAAPTDTHIERDDQRLRATACQRNLLSALKRSGSDR